MTYLQLINAVLTRLREDPVTEDDVNNNFNSNTYLRSIGAHVNDAKDRVEDAWQWGALRGRDNKNIITNQLYFSAPNSEDNHYILKSILVKETGNYLRWYSVPQLKSIYAGLGIPGSVPVQGVPFAFGSIGEVQQSQVDDELFQQDEIGNQAYMLYPAPNANYTLQLDRVAHQDQLVAANDRLLVPSLPVYTLASALAARERGELGGTPVNELFIIADSHLSDAIAIDTSRYPEEMMWYSATNDGWSKTNLRP